MSYLEVLNYAYQDRDWKFNPPYDDYKNLTWLDLSPKPTESELQALEAEAASHFANKAQARQNRKKIERVIDGIEVRYHRLNATQRRAVAAILAQLRIYQDLGDLENAYYTVDNASVPQAMQSFKDKLLEGLSG